MMALRSVQKDKEDMHEVPLACALTNPLPTTTNYSQTSNNPLLDTSKRKYKEEGRQRKEGFPGS